MNRLNINGFGGRRVGRYAFVVGLVAALFPIVAAAQPPGPSGFNTSIFSAAGDTKTGFSVTSFGDTKIGWAASGSTTVSSFQIGVSGTYGSPPNAWNMASGTSFTIPTIGSIKNLQSLATVPVDTVNFFPFNGVQYLSLGTSGTGLPVLFGQQWNLILDSSPATFDIDLPISNFNSGTYQSTFGNTINTMTIVAPVPEPSTWAMGLAGLACGVFSMRRRKNRLLQKSVRCPTATRALAIIAMCAVCFSMRSADAVPALADITWGLATNIAGDSDVDTTGTLVYAYNFGAGFNPGANPGAATVQTVNGVTFQPFGVAGNPTTIGSVTAQETDPGYDLLGDQVLSSTAAPFSGLNAGYQGLLSTGMYAGSTGNIRVDLGGLTPGSAYRLQWWTSDATVSTGSFAPFLEDFDSTFSSGATTSVTLDSNTSNLAGGLGQYVIGTFTASDSTASFLLTGTGNGLVSVHNWPLINAFQLRVVSVPEPSTCIMALAGLACGGYSMWRRRKRA